MKLYASYVVLVVLRDFHVVHVYPSRSNFQTPLTCFRTISQSARLHCIKRVNFNTFITTPSLEFYIYLSAPCAIVFIVDTTVK